MTTASNTARTRFGRALHALALAGILVSSLPATAFADDDDWRRHGRHDDDRDYRDRDRDGYRDRSRYERRDHDERYDHHDRKQDAYYDRGSRHHGYDRNRYYGGYNNGGYNRGRRVDVVWVRHSDHWHPNYVNGRAWRNDYCGRDGYRNYTYFGRTAPRGYYYYDTHGYHNDRKHDNTGAIVAGVGIGLLGLAIAASADKD